MQFFRVDPAAVRQLGATFRSASGRVADDASAFGASARLSRAAFGRLPDGLAAGSQYDRKLEDALHGLAALQAALAQMAANLESNADAYVAADQASLLG